MVQMLRHPALGEIPTVRNPMLGMQPLRARDVLPPPALPEPTPHAATWA